MENELEISLPEISYQKSKIKEAIKMERNFSSKKSFSMYN
jgi:hypothetical protein